MILNEYSKTAWINGASPDINKANLDNLEQGVYDVTAKAMELAAYETNAAASATAASASAVSAAASAAVYTDLAQDVTDLTTVVENHGIWQLDEIVIGTFLGKPLYRKGFAITLPNTSTLTVAHLVANIGVVCIGNDSYATNGSDYMQIPFVNVSPLLVTAYANKTNIIIQTFNNRSTFSGHVFIEYTKTTD